MNILIQATLTGYRPKTSGECSLTFNLPSISEEDLISFYRLIGMSGWLLFSKYEIQPEDVPKETGELNTKSRSQRLRNSLFVHWKQKQNDSDFKLDFETFYNQEMEKYIEHRKSKLLPE